MKFSALLLTYLILTISAIAQPVAPDTIWTKVYIETHEVRGQCVKQTSDGGYIVCGYADTYNSDYDIYLLKTDASGNEQWTRTFGGADFDYGAVAHQTEDGGYIIAGATESIGAGLSDIYLIRTDEWGSELWSRTYGGSDHDGGDCIQILPDGSFIISGYRDCALPDYGVGFLLKTDSNGNEIWWQTYPLSTAGLWVDLTDDGGFIIAGAADQNLLDLVLIRTDSSGTEQWSQTFGGSGWDAGFSAQQTDDGGFILTGEQSGSAVLVKTGSDGVLQWSYTYDFNAGKSVRQTSEGGYIVAGWNNYDIYILKTGANGMEQWHKTVGGPSYDYGYSVLQNDDDQFIISGTTDTYNWGECAYLICLGAESSVPPAEQPQPSIFSFPSAYPNPFNQSTLIRFRMPMTGDVKIDIHDIRGNTVAILIDGMQPAGAHQVPFEASNLSSGIYLVRLTAGDFIKTRKLVLMK